MAQRKKHRRSGLLSVRQFVRRFDAGTLPQLDDTCAGCDGALDTHPDEPGYIMPVPSRGVIEVKQIPRGDPPLWVRRAWLHLQIPAARFESKATNAKHIVKSVTKGQTLPASDRYLVLQTVAIEILEKSNRRAAEWFRQHGLPVKGEHFCFEAAEVIEIERVSPRT